MAEEIKYIPYGDNEIDYNQFVQNSANSVQNYVNQQPWSKKRKQSFLNAYQDLMTRGVTGASNTTGVWTVNHNGEQIDLNSLSKIDREMYGEAAYFIQQQMSGIPTKAKQTAEEKKELPLFDNNYFTTQFQNHISNQLFGGRNYNTQEDWNVLDERGENGLRGTKNRAAKLADMLQSYSDSLEEGKHNFEGTPFKDLSDLKSRIGTAISALRDGNPDNDTEALNQIGLKYDDYLYNGGNDPFKKDGYEGYYSDYYGRYLPEQQERQRQQELAAQQAKLQEQRQQQAQARANQFKRFRFITGEGKSLQELSKYPNVLNQLNGYYDLNALTPDQKAELIGAFKGAAANGQLQNLTREELQRFGSGYINTPNRLKKIDGLNGFYWDTIGNRVIQPFENVASPQSFQNLVNQNNPNTNPRGKGVELTARDYADIGATLADFAALVDPEAISGTILSMGAAVTRTANRDWKNGSFWENLGGSAFDLLTGAIGGLPLIGDASSAVKFIKGAAKLMAIPSIAMALKNAPEAKAAWDKINLNDISGSVKQLTPDDYKALYNFTAGLLGTKNAVKSNLAERKVLQQSGFNTQAKTKRREYANKFGLTPTKAAQTTTTPTVKVKVNGKEQEIEITPESKSRIEEKVNKAGKDSKARNDAVKEELKAAKKIKDADNIEVSAPSSIRDMKYNLDRFRTTKRIFGTQTQATTRGADNFENWLSSRNKWDQYKPWSLGTNSNLRRMRGAMGITKPNTSTQPNQPSGETPKTKVEANNEKMVEDALNPSQKKLRGETKVIKNGTTLETTLNDGNKYTFGFKDNVITISGNGQNIRKLVQTHQEAKLIAANFIKEQNAKVTNGMRKYSSEFIKSIRDLKRKGFVYKEGGTLDKTISDFLNNNNL